MSSLDDCQSAPRVVGYSDERLAAIRDRVRELETNYASVESVSGIQSGYLSNVTADPRPKRMALRTSRWPFLLTEACLRRAALRRTSPNAC